MKPPPPISSTFLSSQTERTYPRNTNATFPSSPSSWPPTATFCLYECDHTVTSQKWNPTGFVLLCPASFSQHSVLKVLPRVASVRISCLLRLIHTHTPLSEGPHSACPLIRSWTWGLLPPFGCCDLGCTECSSPRFPLWGIRAVYFLKWKCRRLISLKCFSVSLGVTASKSACFWCESLNFKHFSHEDRNPFQCFQTWQPADLPLSRSPTLLPSAGPSFWGAWQGRCRNQRGPTWVPWSVLLGPPAHMCCAWPLVHGLSLPFTRRDALCYGQIWAHPRASLPQQIFRMRLPEDEASPARLLYSEGKK